MQKEQIELIKKIADKIITISQEKGNLNRAMNSIEGAGRAYQLRGAIVKLAKATLKSGEEEPFIRFNDFVEYLFPDGQNWNEVRDFLLICLYEKLHELRIDPGEISTEEVSDVLEPQAELEDYINQ